MTREDSHWPNPGESVADERTGYQKKVDRVAVQMVHFMLAENKAPGTKNINRWLRQEGLDEKSAQVASDIDTRMNHFWAQR